MQGSRRARRGRGSPRGWVLGLSAGLGLGACLEPTTRPCRADEECRLDDRKGTCEPDGYCAYPSAECPSGSRYGPFAAQASACTVDCTEVSPELACADDPGCPATCERGDPVLLITWSRPGAAVEPVALAAGRSGLVAVTGAIDGEPLLVLLRDDGTVLRDDVALTPGTTGRAAAVGGDDAVWVALQTTDGSQPGSRVSLHRLDGTGAVLGGVGWATRGEQGVVGLGVDDDDAVTVGGRLDGRAWLERRSSGDALVFGETWPEDDRSIELVDLAVTRGGRVALVGASADGEAGLWLVDPGGALGLRLGLEELGARTTPGAVALGPSGMVIAGTGAGLPWALLVGNAGTPGWLVEPEGVERLADVVLDDQGRATLIGTGEGGTAAWIEQRDWAGELRWKRRLPPEAGRAVAVALDAEQRPLVLGATPSGDGLWLRRFEP